MTKHDQYGSGLSSPLWRRVFAASAFACVLCISVYSAPGISGDPEFWLVMHSPTDDSSVFDTFELHGNNPESAERKCRVTVTITKKNGDTKDFNYELTVPPYLSGKEFAKETGFGPITAKITSQGCQQ